MRNSFFRSLLELAKKDNEIVLMTADMGFALLEPFRDELPDQYVNSGISEANTISMAAGMTLRGKKVYVYSIVPFITYRCLEQIRIDVCYHNADVKIIGVGGGLDYAQSGTTHHSIEDIGIMRSLPNMSVVCPADPAEAAALPEALVGIRTPVYVRLGRGKEPLVHGAGVTMHPPDVMEIPVKTAVGSGPGKDRITILATGNIVYNALKAVEELRESGLDARLVSIPWIKPLDGKFLLAEASKSRLIVTVEEHSMIGGLRSAVVDLFAEQEVKTPVKSIALPDAFQKKVGDREYLRKLNDLDAEGISKRIGEWAKRV